IMKKEIPDKILTLINERIKRTKQQIAFVNKKFFDYQKAITEFQNEQKAFNRQIRILENKIKKLEKIIKKKDIEIEKKGKEIENLHIMINTQSEVIGKKENKIIILEEKISSLQVKYDECVDSNISLSYKLEIERTKMDNLHTEMDKLQNANNEQMTYIQTKDRNLRKLVNENLKLESNNFNLKKKKGMLKLLIEKRKYNRDETQIFFLAQDRYMEIDNDF
ncbi:26264_t:CDS:2, partial [Gigaspora margarita]